MPYPQCWSPTRPSTLCLVWEPCQPPPRLLGHLRHMGQDSLPQGTPRGKASGMPAGHQACQQNPFRAYQGGMASGIVSVAARNLQWAPRCPPGHRLPPRSLHAPMASFLPPCMLMGHHHVQPVPTMPSCMSSHSDSPTPSPSCSPSPSCCRCRPSPSPSHPNCSPSLRACSPA